MSIAVSGPAAPRFPGFGVIAITMHSPCNRRCATNGQARGLKIPDAIILATVHRHGLQLATRNVRDFPLDLGSVLHPYSL